MTKMRKCTACKNQYMGKPSLCTPCNTEYHRVWNLKNPEKCNAHRAVRSALKLGHALKMPCVICGETKRVHAHHEDYARPLAVVWFCHIHHVKRHQELKTANPPNINHLIVKLSEPWTFKGRRTPEMRNISWCKNEKVWRVKFSIKNQKYRKCFADLSAAMSARDAFKAQVAI